VSGPAAPDWTAWARSVLMLAGPPPWPRPRWDDGRLVVLDWGSVVADLAGVEVGGERVAAGAVWVQIEGVGRAGGVTVTVRAVVCLGSLSPRGARRWGWCRARRHRPWPGAGGWSAEGQAAAAGEMIAEIVGGVR